MALLKSKDLKDRIIKERQKERKLLEREYDLLLKRKIEEIEGEYKLQLASLRAEIERLNLQFDNAKKYIIEAEKKENEAEEKTLQAKLIMTALAEESDRVIKNQAQVVKPILKIRNKIKNQQKDLIEE